MIAAVAMISTAINAPGRRPDFAADTGVAAGGGSLCLLEFLWHFRVAQFICVETYYRHADTVFHFAFAEVV